MSVSSHQSGRRVERSAQLRATLAPQPRLVQNQPELSLLKIPPRVCDNYPRSIIDNLHNFRCNTARSHQDFSTSGCAKFKS